MASEVSICNAGLLMLGENPIIALDDNSKAARTCNTLYEQKRDWLIRSHEWKFAISRTNIAPDSASPDHEWDNQFSLPTNCLRLLDIYPTTVTYKVEGRKILSNETILYIRYLKRVTDPEIMDDGFREVLSTVIAKEAAMTLTDSSRKQKAMEDSYEVKLSDARFQGAIEDDLDNIEAEEWLESRI
ncbi:MAG: hypothetical protein GY820_17035 [Gammaproteobacteria bacterium]|nr:hypothetical protein [Gammaproteobacteria bacterium]